MFVLSPFFQQAPLLVLSNSKAKVNGSIELRNMLIINSLGVNYTR